MGNSFGGSAGAEKVNERNNNTTGIKSHVMLDSVPVPAIYLLEPIGTELGFHWDSMVWDG